jgi:small subunit ribosomal protein S9
VAATLKKKYYEGVGSRKRSYARVRVYEGDEASVINGIPLEVFLKGKKKEMTTLLRPFVAAGISGKLYFSGKVKGGGTSGQLGALRMGLARAIVLFDEALRPSLSKEGLLTRDTREVERKKYFLLKARKRPQYSKR